MTPNYVRDLLLDFYREFPNHLKLLLDPTKELWNYYSALGCTTLLENDKSLVLSSVPLLNRDNTLEIFQVINLPIPYPRGRSEAKSSCSI